jgi:hypothetical protein
VILQRRRQHAARAIASEQIPLRLEARIGVGIAQANGLARLGHRARDTVTHAHADRSHLLTDHDA